MLNNPRTFNSRTLLAVGIVSLFACLQSMAWAQQAEKSAALPLTKVVMFNAGLGYFEHQGQVNGDATVELQFRADNINDLLKSMILEDRGGGTISTVSYGSRDPITKTLKSFPIDLTGNPTLGDLLTQIRGERVQVDAPNAITGILLGVETRNREVGKDGQVVSEIFLNLLTDEGLRSILLINVSRIKLLNEKLDNDFRQALTVLATGHDADKKTVTLNLRGNGDRPVRVAYIQETPVWKTSYRLVLNDKESPFLQGWAIVENTTEADWNNVGLTLVSGRPISYRMDLYEPLYVKRPLEELELYASLRPQTYGQDLFSRENKDQVASDQLGAEAVRLRGMNESSRGRPSLSKAMAPGAPASEMSAVVPQLAGEAAFNREQMAQSSAQAGEVGELFQYAIATPVTLARQKSAMLPIVNATVKGEKVSIYNEQVQAKHPLNGLRLTNSTDLHLMQGPLTVFDGGAYAGDAKIEDLAPKAERLISYALDLTTEVAPEGKPGSDQLTSIKLTKGLMHVERKLKRARQYTIKNSDTKAKTVLIEHPFDASWKLIAPEKPAEKTRDRYRFAIQAQPGKPAVLAIDEEQTINQQIGLSNLDDGTISFYLNQKVISPAVKSALQEIVKRKQAIEQIVREKQQLEQQINAIGQEQTRIRSNMGQLDRNADLYKRYVQKFESQESDIEKMRDQITKLTDSEVKLRQALDDYLLKLDVA